MLFEARLLLQNNLNESHVGTFGWIELIAKLEQFDTTATEDYMDILSKTMLGVGHESCANCAFHALFFGDLWPRLRICSISSCLLCL